MNKRPAMDEETAALYKQADLAYARMLVQEQRELRHPERYDWPTECPMCGEYFSSSQEDDSNVCSACEAELDKLNDDDEPYLDDGSEGQS